ncbi:MAG: hypothetical protein VX265_18075 [Myxococcota bacterium]|nr:hypothetical protein [Myxococcota bacterium]
MLPVSAAFSVSRAVSHGWAALKREPVGLLLGALILSVVEGGGGGGGNNLGNLGNLGEGGGSGDTSALGGDWGGNGDWQQAFGDLGGFEDPAVLGVMAIALSCACLLQLVFWLAASFIRPGYLQLHQELLLEGSSSPGRLFGGSAQFKAMAMWKLLKAVIGLGVTVVALAPGGGLLALGLVQETEPLVFGGAFLMAAVGAPVLIYVHLGLMLGAHAVALDDLGPLDALERSWDLAQGNRLPLLVYGFVTGLFHIVGLLLCCVGVIGTVAMIDFGTTVAYLLATRDDHETWRFISQVGLD